MNTIETCVMCGCDPEPEFAVEFGSVLYCEDCFLSVHPRDEEEEDGEEFEEEG